ncbi:MAG: family 43 glycosylhydrolase [Acidimicrobiales bacterium]|nr:family 43 glycosylhydrolase [Acidimicrobiales bacterium]
MAPQRVDGGHARPAGRRWSARRVAATVVALALLIVAADGTLLRGWARPSDAPRAVPRRAAPAEPSGPTAGAELVTALVDAAGEALAAPDPPPGAKLADGPAWGGDFPDPSIVRDGATYYAYATTDQVRTLQVMASSDLEGGWTHLGSAVPSLPGWARWGWSWAPSVARTPAGWVMYYSVREAARDRQCLSRAVGPSPAGPFVDDTAGPMLCAPGGHVIDPSPYSAPDGSRWLVFRWEQPGNAGIAVQRLGDDGLALLGEPRMLLGAGARWEAGMVENPELVDVAGHLYLFYSGNDWRTGAYATGYATCETHLGPCTRRTVDAPLLRTAPHAVGTGGAGFVVDQWGNLRMAFHAWDPGRVGYAAGGRRTLHLATVLVAQGRPLVAPEARSLAVRAEGGGWVLTAGGAVAPFGGAPDLGGADLRGAVARDLVPMSDGAGYLVLDGWGGLHRFGSAAGLPVDGAAWWPGWDVARAAVVLSGGEGGWVLDAFGGLHPFGLAPRYPGSAYWPGWDVARDLALLPDGSGGWVLDGWGGLHPWGGATRLDPVAWWPGWDIARTVRVVVPGTTTVAGRVLARTDASASTLPASTVPASTVPTTTPTTVATTVPTTVATTVATTLPPATQPVRPGTTVAITVPSTIPPSTTAPPPTTGSTTPAPSSVAAPTTVAPTTTSSAPAAAATPTSVPPSPYAPLAVVAVLDGFGGVHLGGPADQVVRPAGGAWRPADVNVALAWAPSGWWVLRADGLVQPG